MFVVDSTLNTRINAGWYLLFPHACVGVGKARLGAALLHIDTEY